MMCWWYLSCLLKFARTRVCEGVRERVCHPGSSWAVVTAELSVLSTSVLMLQRCMLTCLQL